MTDTLVNKTETIEELGTLVDQLVEIEKAPFYLKIDKKAACKEVFELWREENNLVDRAIKGEIDLLKEYKAFLKEFAGAKNYCPHYHSSGEYKRRLNYLLPIIGYFGLDNVSNIIFNPVSVGGIGAACTAIGTKTGPSSKQEMDRRKFLEALTPGVLLAIGGGGVLSLIKKVYQYLGKENASYIQSRINKVYNL